MPTSGEPREVLRPSLLERLLAGGQRQQRRSYELDIGVRELKNEVKRDLEHLLNTRCPPDPDLREFPEVQESVVAYGLPDFSQFSQSSEGDLQTMRKLIEDTIRRFEPRFSGDSVKVSLDRESNTDKFSVRFRVEALLDVEPIQEFVSFDTSIEFTTGNVDIRESN